MRLSEVTRAEKLSPCHRTDEEQDTGSFQFKILIRVLILLREISIKNGTGKATGSTNLKT